MSAVAGVHRIDCVAHGDELLARFSRQPVDVVLVGTQRAVPTGAEATRRLVAAGVPPDEVDAEQFAAQLYAPDMPDPDLLIRTSGEHRISNFLLWQLAYSELVFVDRLWPDFGADDLQGALEEYAGRRRRFGGR
jgi:undecaprenyl diphosphate synthase